MDPMLELAAQKRLDERRALAEVARLRELLAESKGSVRLLAEELEAGADPRDIAAQLHDGADHMGRVLDA